MFKQLNQRRGGFTLVEIMIVVAIIALLAAIAVPNFLRSRKRSQATRILEDLRNLDHAIDQYSIDNGKPGGFQPEFADLQNYLKPDSVLRNTGTDLFGNSYGPFAVDSIPKVPSSAFEALSDVADASYWGQYYTADSGTVGSQYSASNPMNPQNFADAMGPILALDDVLGAGGTPTQSQIDAARTANQIMAQTQAAGGIPPNLVQNYTNAITNNFNNNTVHIADYLTTQ